MLAAVLVIFVGYLPSTTAGKDNNLKHTDNYAGGGCGEEGMGVGGRGPQITEADKRERIIIDNIYI